MEGTQLLWAIYRRHFKAFSLFNIGLSLLLSGLFFKAGFRDMALYNLAIFLKGLGYLITFGVERLFFSDRGFYFKNLSLSYRRLFIPLFTADFLIFLFLLCLTWLIRSFI